MSKMIVSLDAFLASEEYAKESIKDLKNHQGSKPGLKGGCAAGGIPA